MILRESVRLVKLGVLQDFQRPSGKLSADCNVLIVEYLCAMVAGAHLQGISGQFPDHLLTIYLIHLPNSPACA